MWILGLKGLSKSSAVYQGKFRITVCIGIFFFNGNSKMLLPGFCKGRFFFQKSPKPIIIFKFKTKLVPTNL